MKVFKTASILLWILIMTIGATVYAAPCGEADLGISVTDSPDPVIAGNEIAYQITVENFGPECNAKKVEITIAMPSGVTYASGPAANPVCVGAGNSATCNFNGNYEINPGGDVFTVNVLVDPAATGIANTHFEVTSDWTHATDSNLANNEQIVDTTITSEADLSVTKTDQADPVLPGLTVTYDLVASNAGPSAATSVSVVDTLPAGTTFDSASAGCTNDTPALGQVTCTATAIAPNSSANFSITVVAPATPQEITNNVSVSSATTDNNSTNDSDDEDTLVDAVPVADDQSVSVDEDGSLPITTTASDGDDDTLTWTLVDGPNNGQLTGTLPNVTYEPDADYNGPDSFTFTVNDGLTDSNVGTVSITVDPVNDPPTADDDSYSVDEDGSINEPALSGVLSNDDDVENDSLTAELVNDVSNGILVLNGDGSFTYDPNANFNGEDTFTYIAKDATEDSNEATVTITVNAVNDDPDAVDDSDSTDEDIAVTTDVLGNDTDVDNDTLTVTGVTQGTNGGVVDNGDGTITYTPNSAFIGTDSYTYDISDGNGGTDTATVEITVSEVIDISIGDVQVDEPLSSTSTATVTVTLSEAASTDITVDYETEADTATADDDYDTTSGTLTIPQGDLSGEIDVTINSDATPFEGSETLFVNISNATSGTILDGQGTVTITDSCLFCDDFENSTLDTTNWIYTPLVGSPWSEDGDNLVAVAIKKATAFAEPGFVPGCQTCTIDVTVSTAGGIKNKIWIFGWSVNKFNRMELLMKEETDVWLLKQRVGGVAVKKAKTKLFPIVPGVSYNVKIAFTGTQFEVSIDGTPAFILIPQGAVPTGTVGFQVKATTARFGQIIVN